MMNWTLWFYENIPGHLILTNSMSSFETIKAGRWAQIRKEPQVLEIYYQQIKQNLQDTISPSILFFTNYYCTGFTGWHRVRVFFDLSHWKFCYVCILWTLSQLSSLDRISCHNVSRIFKWPKFMKIRMWACKTSFFATAQFLWRLDVSRCLNTHDWANFC